MKPSATPHLHPNPTRLSRGARPTLAPTGAEQAQPAESATPCSPLLTSASPRLCAGIRANGERCRARASSGHDFCSFHRVDLREAFHAGRVRGGLQRRFELTGLDEQAASRLSLGLDSRGGIQAGLDTLLRLVFAGKVSPKYIAAVTRIYATALRNIEHTGTGAEDHTFAAYDAALAANHRLHAEVEAAALQRQAAAERARQALTEALRRLVDESYAHELPPPSPAAPGRA